MWHDIPLYLRDEDDKATGNLNFVCEIPRCSRKKFEISTTEAGNPIKQDTKKGLLREFKKASCTALQPRGGGKREGWRGVGGVGEGAE